MAELEKMKYEEALGRLEKIVAQIEDPQTAVGDIPAKVKEAAELLTSRKASGEYSMKNNSQVKH